MIVGTIQQKENSSWQEASDSWMELDEGEASEVYCVGTCQGVSNQVPEVGEEYPSEALHPPEDEEIMEGGWWSPDPRELQVGDEQEYFIELLMGGSAAGERKAALERPPAASGHGRSAGQKRGSSRTGGPTPRRGSGKQAGHGQREREEQ